MAYSLIAYRDGERCGICHRGPPKKQLDIDHIDGDPKNRAETNLRLLCRSCNIKAAYARSRGISIVSKKKLREREREREGENEPKLKDRLGYGDENASPEMRANRHYEGTYRTWVLYQVETMQRVPRSDLVNGGAEFVHCSTQSAERYLRKLTSQEGPLYMEQDPKLGIIVVARETRRGEAPKEAS